MQITLTLRNKEDRLKLERIRKAFFNNYQILFLPTIKDRSRVLLQIIHQQLLFSCQG